MDFGGFYRVLVGFGGFYWVLLGFGGFDGVLVGFTGFYRDLLGFTGFFTTGHGWSNGALTLSETRFKKKRKKFVRCQVARGRWLTEKPSRTAKQTNNPTLRHGVSFLFFLLFFLCFCLFFILFSFLSIGLSAFFIFPHKKNRSLSCTCRWNTECYFFPKKY